MAFPLQSPLNEANPLIQTPQESKDKSVLPVESNELINEPMVKVELSENSPNEFLSESDILDKNEFLKPTQIENNIVVNLVELTPFTSIYKTTFGHTGAAGLHQCRKSVNIDNMGNSNYETGFTFSNNTQIVREYTYILERQYARFTGILAVDFMSRDDVEKGYFMILTVYGDGRKLYTSPELRGGVRPIPFDVDISGVDEFKFAIEIDTPGITKTLFTLLLDPQLSTK